MAAPRTARVVDPAAEAEARRPDARRVALDALVRVDTTASYANLLLPSVLERSGLAANDRAFVTNLVYGTTRMRRACDWLIDRFLLREIDPPTRAALRMGAYQLAFLDTPPHAAVGETVRAVPKRTRGFVNAVLRRVSDNPCDWPDHATRLSYPDWIVDRLVQDLGEADALVALEHMNRPGTVTERDDGYVQDLGSQLVVQAVDAQPGHLVVDTCAAPGGKATALAATGALVVAGDRRLARANLVAENVATLGLQGKVLVVVADGRGVPLAPRSADRVLVDAPCSGLGALRRRADARWRIDEEAMRRLVEVQVGLLQEAVGLVRPGGELTYSVCTLTRAEGPEVVARVQQACPQLQPLPPPDAPWEPWDTGARLLPQTADTDGMALFRWSVPT